MIFRVPGGAIVTGATQCGKTTFMARVVREAKNMLNPPPASIAYCYGERDADVSGFATEGAIVRIGLPSDQFISEMKKPAMIIIDDLMSEITAKYLTDMFTKKAHHRNLSVWFITQNLYEKPIRVARINAQYIVQMRDHNCKQSLRTLAVQLFGPGKADYVENAYDQATAEEDEDGYLVIDNNPRTKRHMRLRSHIFPDETPVVYLEKGL